MFLKYFIVLTCLCINVNYVYAQAPIDVSTNVYDANLPTFTHPKSVSNDLAQIDASFNNTLSLTGRFTQYSSSQALAKGKLYLRRPGRIRFEYDHPTSLLIVSDGVTIVTHDSELEKTDRVPLSSVPLAFFLTEKVNLENDVEVVSLQKTPKFVALTAKDGSGNMSDLITFVFDPDTLNLREWIIFDGFNQSTRTVLSDQSYNLRLSSRLFTFKGDKKRRRQDW